MFTHQQRVLLTSSPSVIRIGTVEKDTEGESTLVRFDDTLQWKESILTCNLVLLETEEGQQTLKHLHSLQSHSYLKEEEGE